MAQTLHWPRHHAVEASALATSSCICMKISSGASAPPRLFGSSARYIPFSTSAETTGSVSRRVRSISSASRVISGASARARSTRSKPGSLVHASPRPFSPLAALAGGCNGGPSAAADQDGVRRPLRQAAARPRSSEGCAGRRFEGKLSATATAARPMANEPACSQCSRGRYRTPAAGPWSERHAEAGKGGNRAEHRAHDARAEKFAHQHGVERHHPAIGEAEHDRQRIEFAELEHREIGRDAQRLHQQAADQHRLGAETVRHRAEQQTAAESGKAGEAVDGDRGQRRNAADHGVAHHVEDRAGMRRAAGRNAPAPA